MEKRKKRYLTPPRVLLLSFVVLITIGTFLLSLPIAVKEGVDNSVLTALFTSTSAASRFGASFFLEISNDIFKLRSPLSVDFYDRGNLFVG